MAATSSTPRHSSSRKQAMAEHVAEMMASFAPVQVKPMFGGFGVYWQGLMFAILIGERLYFKADEVSQPHFEARGLKPFTYESKGKVARLRYHEAPSEVYDEPLHMAEWARLGHECAVRAQAAKAKAAAKASARRRPADSATAKRAAHGEAVMDDLRNLGPRSRDMLAAAGIRTAAQLRQLGAVKAYARTKAACPKASLNLLWALEGALTGRDWREVAESERASLLMALEDVQAHGQ